ncbi:chymotrypsinogen A [Ceratitis capitata]|uniref:chymotrypsinogen A n=1 Tax=Ceratitis capitata TaxID=7213 RepID=UPI0006188938|nr:chymotrypsinogen A [Ceratitis capitata]
MKFFLLGLLLIDVACATPNTAALRQSLTKATRNIQPEARIIGGEPATKSSRTSYLISLSISAIAYAHVCAGAIIGKEWVLTAAHCLEELKESATDVIGLPVYAGLQDRSDIENAQIRTIDFAFAHKQFNASQEGSPDIALLHVTPGFEFGADVNAVILPYRNEDYANKTSVTYGWGLTRRDAEQYAKQLQVGSAQVLSETQCREQLPEDTPLGSNQICAETLACFGDGGSPLVHETLGGTELVGITSWGYTPCGSKGSPTVYTEVSRFIKWISDVQWAYYVLN